MVQTFLIFYLNAFNIYKPGTKKIQAPIFLQNESLKLRKIH